MFLFTWLFDYVRKAAAETVFASSPTTVIIIITHNKSKGTSTEMFLYSWRGSATLVDLVFLAYQINRIQMLNIKKVQKEKYLRELSIFFLCMCLCVWTLIFIFCFSLQICLTFLCYFFSYFFVRSFFLSFFFSRALSFFAIYYKKIFSLRLFIFVLVVFVVVFYYNILKLKRKSFKTS